ncbi:Dirigent protein [Quillaja saponaria]|uniref:Dirigent protein n=1 Tax=Quillaja saponaria TaxID=32244 RepID=A0AAD7Q5E9_QUISA|nr:Dirigent protein [Quillaja saponaria]
MPEHSSFTSTYRGTREHFPDCGESSRLHNPYGAICTLIRHSMFIYSGSFSVQAKHVAHKDTEELTVVGGHSHLLALFSPVSKKKKTSNHSRPWLALSLYIQQHHISSSNVQPALPADAGAFIFQRALTGGPENISRIVWKVQGFIIPMEQFAHSAFNVIYLTFDTPDYSGSLGVRAKHVAHKDIKELTVVGGTGSFALARGLAVFALIDMQQSDMNATYHVKLQLKFQNHSRTIRG